MITEEIIQEALRLRGENPRMTFRQVAEQLLGDGDFATALRKSITDQQRDSENSVLKNERRRVIPQELPEITELPEQYKMYLPKPLQANVSNAIIFGDLHCPHVDRGLVQQVLKESLACNIDTVILAGDIIDGQFTGRHKNPPEYVAPATHELEYMQYYLDYLEREFAEVYVLPGNHDGWVTDYFDMDFTTLINTMLPNNNLHVSKYGYMYINDNIVVGHLEEWNETPGYLAWKIAQQFGRHAIVNHDHIRGVYSERGNKYYGVSVGASLVPANIYYKNASFNSYPAIDRGYAVLQNKTTLRLMAWDGESASVDKIIHLGD